MWGGREGGRGSKKLIIGQEREREGEKIKAKDPQD